MALLERVTTLIRANLNDLIDKAEDPEKMIKQVITDMENQLLQVKTQVAVAIADLHLLEKKRKDIDESTAEWMKKAELAVDKKRDDLARSALERHKSGEQLSESYRQQIDDQQVQVENLKTALKKLEQKLAEAQAKSQMLVTQHRRARALSKASDAQLAMGDRSKVATFERLKTKVMHGEAVSQAKSEMVADSVEEEFARLSGEDEIERRLAELKARRTGAHT